jgi:hypothetical protein
MVWCLLKHSVKVNLKMSLCLSSRPLRRIGDGGIAPRILDLGTRRRGMISFTPRPLNRRGKRPWYQLDRISVGSTAGLNAMEKRKFPAPARNRTPEPRSSSPKSVTIPTELFLINFASSFGYWELEIFGCLLTTTTSIAATKRIRKTVSYWGILRRCINFWYYIAQVTTWRNCGSTNQHSISSNFDVWCKDSNTANVNKLFSV